MAQATRGARKIHFSLAIMFGLVPLDNKTKISRMFPPHRSFLWGGSMQDQIWVYCFFVKGLELS